MPVALQRPRALMLLLLAVLVPACSSSSFNSASPSGSKCALTLNASAANVDAAGGNITIDVVTTPECTWTVANDAAWVTDVIPASGQGSATVAVHVMPNGDSVTRTADVRVNDKRTSVRQDGSACQFTIAPVTLSVGAAGAQTAITISTLASCSWTIGSTAPWITPNGESSGVGPATVALSVAANTGAARTGTVSVGGRGLTVTQTAAGDTTCTFTLSSVLQNVIAAGGAATPVTVTAAAGCAWTAVSATPWVTLAPGSGGSGNGTVSFTVAANTGAARAGSITIAGQTFTVSQAGTATPPGNGNGQGTQGNPPACTSSIAPLSQSMSASGGASAPISVTTASTCPWTAVSGASWLTITAGASGTGSGTVRFTAAANVGPQRSGTLTIAGQTFQVTQASGCTYGVAPTRLNIENGGGPSDQPISVTTAAGCSWSAQSNDSWLTITSGATGSGDGTVRFTAGKGTNKARTGTLTVAAQTVTIIQEKK